MRSPIATLAVATALTLACPQSPARADGGIDDICVIVTVSGVVNASVGHCEPTPNTTNEFRDGFGQPGILWIEVYVRLP